MTLAERFNAKVLKTNGCWEWIGAKQKHGYGSIYRGGRGSGTMLATHVSLELDGRARPSEKHHALHSCDNPGCVNPAHLRWGCHAENMRDMKVRGRLNTSGLKDWPARNPQNKKKTHCKRGHLLAGENLYVSPTRRRMCAVCMRDRKAAARMALAMEGL